MWKLTALLSLRFAILSLPWLALSYSTQRGLRLTLRPTGSLPEQKRRRLQGETDNSTESWPWEWFHPQVAAVYATLHGDPNLDVDPVFQDFQAHRHFSRHERAFRIQHSLNLHPHWSGNYSEMSIAPLPFNSTQTPGIRHLIQSSTAKSSPDDRTSVPRYRGDTTNPSASDKSSVLPGGQFNHYQGVPLSQGYGTHYVHLWVGSPIPQRQSVIVDTGSHFTAFPCQGCQKCGAIHHSDPAFDPSMSTTFHPLVCPSECREQATCSSTPDGKPLPSNTAGNAHKVAPTSDPTASKNHTDMYCHFAQSYTEGSSWNAYQAQDVVYAGGPDVLEAANPHDRHYALPFVFGCQQDSTGLFQTQLADGIMGMSAHEATLTKQLYNLGKLEYNMFAMCFRKELGTSKRGVSAGSLTLGGVSSTLDTTPMVYARNTQPNGWFTVKIENIYIAKHGGTQFLMDSPDAVQDIVKIPVDITEVNSGKGVIVDSGTTDTYLNAEIQPAFAKVWKQVTGTDYKHGPVYLTEAQLHRLPTILIQCQAATPSSSETVLEEASEEQMRRKEILVGQAGLLDPERRTDVLLAIPAKHYMEYSPALKMYTFRLYFSESRGGVLGANAMQGHNVLFDWQHGRLGFSQSTCEHDLVAEESLHEKNSYLVEDGTTENHNECVLGPPVLTQPCVESVNISVCEKAQDPSDVDVSGVEVWTRVVESPGLEEDSCENLLAGSYAGQTTQSKPPQVNCTLDGLCVESWACSLCCSEVLEDVSSRSDPLQKTEEDTAGPTRQDYSQNGDSVDACGDSFWSACDYDCKQSRLHTIKLPAMTEATYGSTNSNDVCLEVSRSTRDCHVDVCGRTDPCEVPFLVHAILILDIGEDDRDDKWTPKDLVTFQEEFTRISHLPELSSLAARQQLFQNGDVDILAARPWSDFEEDHARGGDNRGLEDSSSLQLILQVSIFNPHARKIPASERSSGRRSLLQEAGVLWQKISQTFSAPKQNFACNPSDLYPLAKNAVELANGILEHPTFGSRLVENMPSYSQARVVSSWTIGTQVYDDEVNYNGPMAMTPYLAMFQLLYETSVVFLFVSACSCTIQFFYANRHVAGPRLRRWCWGKRPRYQILPTHDPDNTSAPDTVANGGSTEIELTYAHKFSDIHRKNAATTTKRHNSIPME